MNLILQIKIINISFMKKLTIIKKKLIFSIDIHYKTCYNCIVRTNKIN